MEPVHLVVLGRRSSSLRASAACYGTLAGLQPLMDHGWVDIVDAPGGGAQLNLVTRDASAPIDAEVSIGVDEVDSCYSAAVRAHFELVHPLTDEPWGVRRFFVRDPDGHVRPPTR